MLIFAIGTIKPHYYEHSDNGPPKRLKDIDYLKQISMITTSQHTTLSIGQLHILEMMNRCKTEESLRQLKKLLFDFYAKEAVTEADRLWEAGVINEDKIEEWGHEHMRTPYIHAK